MTETTFNYKATFILDTRNREETPEELIEGLKAELVAAGGEVTGVEDLGKSDFERAADRRYTAGNYVQFLATGTANFPAAVLEALQLNTLVSHKMIQKA
ncbi:30S ribosomal protein S6 [Puniceicoccaceae bacterium K14]|nr:30S ribosomal protein S6 [Puniceicoccaceae bacterium K14]